ncbi:unnamed protein product [Boreogadus saida]
MGPGLCLRRAAGFLNVFLERRQAGVCLLTQSKTSTSSPRARPPPPVRSPPEQLKGEAERLGTGGLWCQDGPETEAGDQGPAAPDQRNVFLERRRAGRGAVNLEDDHHSTNKDYVGASLALFVPDPDSG